jgi:hypothetical protein
MQEQIPDQTKPKDALPDEDGTVLVYGFLKITDAQTGQVLVSTRA